jgi:hypothetical protein
LRFLGGSQEVLSRGDGEAWLTDLIQETLARLRDSKLGSNSASLRWERVLTSRRSDERYFCEAVGGLGLDPYTVSDELASFVESAENIFEDEPLVEFVTGAADVDQSRLLNWVQRMVGIKGGQYRLANLRPLVTAIDTAVPQHPNEPAWSAGYRRARTMRRELDLKQNQEFGSFIDLARKLGSAKAFNVAPKVDGISALRREAQDGIHVHVRNHGDGGFSAPMHLFSLARAIGDATCFPAEETAPINRLQSAYRQAAGRAFAAEFLAPIDEILSMQNDDKDEFTIANAFGVTPAVIARQLENQTRIAQACI